MKELMKKEKNTKKEKFHVPCLHKTLGPHASYMTGGLLRGWSHHLRLAKSFETGLIKFLKDCQHFGLATGAWPLTAGCAVANTWILMAF